MARSASLRIAVVGAGLGGLTAAVALRQAGFDVDVYEQAPELTEVGGGINMGPNAARVLYRLGLGKALDREAVRPLSTHQRRWQDGRTLQRAPLNPRCEELYGAPHLTVHRADLLAIIASGFPAERIHLAHRLVGLDDKGDYVETWFENGARVTADVVVGADGINSTVRATLFGEEAPRFAGCVAYRGLVPTERIADLGLELGSQSWVGPGGHFVHYFVSRGRLLNFVGWTEHDTWNREDWTDRATVTRALAAFEGWHSQIGQIVAAADTCFIWALYDREPLPTWTRQRLTLLGDAAHPMLPHLGQGANQAIEDGMALATILARSDQTTAPLALTAYERLRRERVAQVQRGARENGLRYDSAYSDLGVRDAEITAHAAFRRRLYDHDVVPEAQAAASALT